MRRGMLTTIVAVTAAALAVTVAPSATAAKNGYTDYHVGNAKDVVAKMKGGTLLSGGGIDDSTAMRWLLGRGGGKVDVVVLDAWGKDIYGQPFLDWGADSVDTFVITARDGANDPAVVDAINVSTMPFVFLSEVFFPTDELPGPLPSLASALPSWFMAIQALNSVSRIRKTPVYLKNLARLIRTAPAYIP